VDHTAHNPRTNSTHHTYHHSHTAALQVVCISHAQYADIERQWLLSPPSNLESKSGANFPLFKLKFFPPFGLLPLSRGSSVKDVDCR